MDVLRTEAMLMRKEKGMAAKAISQRLHQSDKLQSKADTLSGKQAIGDEDGHMPTQVVLPTSPRHSHLDCSFPADLAAVIWNVMLFHVLECGGCQEHCCKRLKCQIWICSPAVLCPLSYF